MTNGPKELKELTEKFLKESLAYLAHERLDKEAFADWAGKFLHSAIKSAFEATRIEGVETELDFKEELSKEDIGFNQALTEVTKRQEEYLGGGE